MLYFLRQGSLIYLNCHSPCVNQTLTFDVILSCVMFMCFLTNKIHSDPVSSIHFLLYVPCDHQIFRLANGVMGGADGEGGASIWGDQISVTGGPRQPQHEGLLVQTIDSVCVWAIAVTNRILTALPSLAAAGRGGHGRQAQEPILVQVLQENIQQETFRQIKW